MDVVDRELERMVERRSRKDQDADEREELWKASVRRYNARRSEEMRAAWCDYHHAQAARHRAVLEALISRHEEQAARLMEAQPKGDAA